MKLYVATFHCDIAEYPPLVASTLPSVLYLIQRTYRYGLLAQDHEDTFSDYVTPDPEDDKIEVWCFDTNGNADIVWGFWGWHWSIPAEPADLQQGIMPGNTESLYTLANG